MQTLLGLLAEAIQPYQLTYLKTTERGFLRDVRRGVGNRSKCLHPEGKVV